MLSLSKNFKAFNLKRIKVFEIKKRQQDGKCMPTTSIVATAIGISIQFNGNPTRGNCEYVG
jgi:hypothetical protein